MSDHSDLKARARVFFALWPDAATREQLACEARRIHVQRGGRLTRVETLHLTLVFIGDIARERLTELIRAAVTVRAPYFDIDFDQAGLLAPQPDCLSHASQPPDALHELVDSLEQALAAAAFVYDQRPYKPHITLVRRGDCPTAAPAALATPIHWSAREFVLVESRLSQDGPAYTVVERFGLVPWPLKTPQA
ncbi:MAG: RNA 2',3'-cyclic phosphodiesterase [Hydrogenophilales bacterium]|nr:RNA 2',3'-cyclic phosphodiesterase [Hydrogenophilales bacterium]